ncbi:MAG: FAD-dependent oxidoreductase, partial [Bacteroidales bacterium]|nr:FAD-dependent oxidoreductase [Bacteroidales bacterium]
RSITEMLAEPEEIEEAQKEGVKIHFLVAPMAIARENGRVAGVQCIRTRLTEPDTTGRRKPIPVEGSEFFIEADIVIPAIGQEPDLEFLGKEPGIEISRWNLLMVNPETLQTSIPGIFAGGDVITGPATVIEAVDAGKRAARYISKYLQGEELPSEWQEEPPIGTNWVEIRNDEPTRHRLKVPTMPVEKRLSGFEEVNLCADDKDAMEEAARCLNCGGCCECYECVKVCKAGAVTFDTHMENEQTVDINVGAVILSPGFQPFDPSKYQAYHYSKYPNVITSMEFERILSATGPYQGHLVRPSDEKEPKKIAWLQCVGSRDVHGCDHGYCSSVCCMYAIKEAVIAKEHAGSNLDCAVFFMDMRTHGKDFERYYDDAKMKHGVRFINSRVPTIDFVEGSDDLSVQYVTEDGKITEEIFDMVVLSVGIEISSEQVKLAGDLGIQLTEGNFCETESFSPVDTSREGIYVCGAFQGPKDIPQSVIEASSAAAKAGALLSEARNTETKTREFPSQRNIAGERPRIGVFVCHCGINIGGVVDVPAVRDYAASLPFVEYCTDNLFTCSQDTQDTIAQVIEEKRLNRIVVAACTPKTHEPLFQETMVNAGLNKYLFEMTNIRNQDSWVHKDNPEMATEKARDLVRMAVSKVALMEPLYEAELEVNQKALVIGGGIAGLVAAKSLSAQGYEVCIAERSSSLGGQALNLFRTWKGEDIQLHLNELIKSVESDKNIDIHLETELSNVDGFVGNFVTTLKSNDSEETVEHGIAVIATGGKEFKPDEYLYGKDPRVVTHLELDQMFIKNDSSLKDIRNAVFIQCVGSREPQRPYCSRVCCSHSIESALHLKELNPEMNVFVLYRDIRTYGEREYLYRKARLAGIIFIRFSKDQKPNVMAGQEGLQIEVNDKILGETVVLKADLLALATGIVSNDEENLAQLFKVPLNEDGFFVEAHAKLGPSEFATGGVFLCGMAHYPKPIDESVAQAEAASSRAVT